jgi:hypothetical protein
MRQMAEAECFCLDLQEVGMDKISGIIPSSARVTAVDMKESAVRPGTPSFGRPEGSSALREAAATAGPVETTASRSAGIHQAQLDWRSKDAKNAAIASEMSNKFFMKAKPEPAELEEDDEPVKNIPVLQTSQFSKAPQNVESRPAGFKTDDSGFLRAASAKPEIAFKAPPKGADEEPILQQPEGLYPKGFFLDRSA